MELRKGYKLSEIGSIPEDWEITTLSDLVDSNRTIRYGIVQPGKFEPEGRYMVRGQDYSFGWADPYDFFRVTALVEERYKNARLKGGDLIITIVGAGTGHFEIVPDWLDGANMTQTTARIAIDKSKADSKFCKYYFQSAAGKRQISVYIKGAAQPGLNVGDVKIFRLPLPPTKSEQTAIANALSDADALISSLEKLIEKKRNIKQGAMQQLLKPKKGWEFLPLHKVVWYQEGPGVRNHQFTKNGVKLLNGTNIEKGKLLLDKTERYISEHEAFGWYSHFLADDGDIIIACSGVTINKFDEKVTFVKKKHLPLCMNTSTMRFKIISDNLDIHFFFHFLKSDSFKEQIGGKATGSAQLNFGPSHVQNVQIALPKKTEQKEIATILSEMDNEIISLEKKLSKSKMLKQGMMQELLTGKIRLV